VNRYTLEIRSGEEMLRAVSLPEDRETTLGRARENNVVLPQGLVSSRHAVIEPAGNGLALRDLGSTNGTYVNGERIEEPHVLVSGDRIAVGALKLILRVKESNAQASVTFHDGDRDTQQIFAQIDTGKSVILPSSARAETFRALEAASRNLAVLHEMGGLLLGATEEDGLCAHLLELVFDVLPADRAAVIVEGPSGEPEIRAARSRSKGRENLSVSRTILRKSLEEGLSLFTSDAVRDERFRNEQSIIVQGIRAAMCAPIRGQRNILGALYVDTEFRTGAFRKEDLELLTTLGIQGGIAVENLRLREQNLSAERLAAIGGVVTGLSHDIRNILSALRGGAYVMDKLLTGSKESDLAEAWGIVKDGTDTIAVLVENMVSYSKEREPSLRPTDMNERVGRVATRFASKANEFGITLTTDLSPDLPNVDLDPSAIDRVLSNLVANALDAIGTSGGTVTVRTGVGEGHAEISIEDDGPGIPELDRDRIFDLLFSTKGSKGTGFGLAITKKIVTEHGGSVDLESQVGAGTTFLIRLPLTASDAD